MAGRRDFIQRALIGCGAVAFIGRTKAFTLWLTAAKPNLLPEGWQFFESNGNVLFNTYGITGGINCEYYCWLIQKVKKQWYCIPVRFTWEEVTPTHDAGPLELKVNRKLQNAIARTKPIPVDMNGGELPRLPTADA